MEIVVNKIHRKVIDVQIVYDNDVFYDKYFYFIEVKCEVGRYFSEWKTIDVFKSSEDAIKRYEYLKDNINSNLVIER